MVGPLSCCPSTCECQKRVVAAVEAEAKSATGFGAMCFMPPATEANTSFNTEFRHQTQASSRADSRCKCTSFVGGAFDASASSELVPMEGPRCSEAQGQEGAGTAKQICV